ncbi:MAG: hypothetical protein V3V53_17075 [Bacteroidales bacterium]|jgi:hypothetical protein|nr:hypothetical protein [Bacteroidales bacterium]
MEVINNIKEKAEHLIQQGYETDAGTYIRRGWEIFQENIGMFIGYTLITIAISVAAAFIPFGSLLVSGPLTAGFYIVANKISKGEPYEFGTFFKGFDFFVPLLLWTLIGGIFIALGLVALIVPGIYLAVAYTFVPLFIVFGKIEFWDGMEFSRKLVTKKWWNIFGFVLLLMLINMAGALAFLVGLLFTIPLTYCAIYVAFEDIVGTE